ncbi:MAG TPA: alpha/beta fold hydrolase [Thermoanaerobaculia bacterium]|nr:alpha/beta fold hydrolase [Thermoanaerobaculia bacterium]
MRKIEITLDDRGASWIWRSPDEGRREPNLILFIHGYTGSPASSWGRFPDLLRHKGEGFDSGFEIASFGYETKFPLNKVKLEQLSDLLFTFLEANADPASDIFIVAHSLGGLVAKCFLVRCHSFPIRGSYISRIRQMHFIGVPHLGTPLVHPLFRHLGFLNSLAPQAHRNSITLRELDQQWKRIRDPLGQNAKSFPEIHNYIGIADSVAPISSFSAEEDIPHLVASNHTALIKPHDSTNYIYTLVTKSIKGARRTALGKRQSGSWPLATSINASQTTPGPYLQGNDGDLLSSLKIAQDSELLTLLGLVALGADVESVSTPELALWTGLSADVVHSALQMLGANKLVSTADSCTTLTPEAFESIAWLFDLDEVPGVGLHTRVVKLREHLRSAFP